MPSERDPVDSYGFNSLLITIWCQVWGFSLHFVVLASYFLYMFLQIYTLFALSEICFIYFI